MVKLEKQEGSRCELVQVWPAVQVAFGGGGNLDDEEEGGEKISIDLASMKEAGWRVV